MSTMRRPVEDALTLRREAQSATAVDQQHAHLLFRGALPRRERRLGDPQASRRGKMLPGQRQDEINVDHRLSFFINALDILAR
jgi:hypothetical protein